MRKKTLLALAVAVTMAVSLNLNGCGGNDEKPARTEMTTVQEESMASVKESKACSDIVDEILKEIPDTHNDTKTVYGEEKYDNYFDYLYKEKIDKIDDGAFAYASESYADEITVVHFKETSDATAFKEKLEDRIERRKQDFNGYKPEEVKKLEKAKTLIEGNYAVMAVGDNADGIIDDFREIIKGNK